MIEDIDKASSCVLTANMLDMLPGGMLGSGHAVDCIRWPASDDLLKHVLSDPTVGIFNNLML